jgi:peptidoglycan/xylan/chitin deacetylase (PgdA/CDA1 family)
MRDPRTVLRVLASPPIERVLRLAVRVSTPRFMPVFCMHHLKVTPVAGSRHVAGMHQSLGDLSPETLAQRVRELKSSFEFVTCRDMVTRLVEGTKAPLAALTFDDGSRDVTEVALPILQALGVPATAFVITNYLDSGGLPWPLKIRLMRRLLPLHNGGAWPGEAVAVAIDPSRRRIEEREFVPLLFRRLRAVAPSEIEATIARWTVRLPMDPCAVDIEDMSLHWDQLEQLIASGWEIASHSVHHPWFPGLSAEERVRELVESRRALEERLGINIAGFCVPWGSARHVDACPPEMLRAAGYMYACTSLHGFNTRMKHVYQLRRTHLIDEPDSHFHLRRAGIVDLLASVWQALPQR